jgi:hypothetical protein
MENVLNVLEKLLKKTKMVGSLKIHRKTFTIEQVTANDSQPEN